MLCILHILDGHVKLSGRMMAKERSSIQPFRCSKSVGVDLSDEEEVWQASV